MSEYFQRCPIFTAGRLFSEGQGKESNDFTDPKEHERFDVEMERLELSKRQEEAMQP